MSNIITNTVSNNVNIIVSPPIPSLPSVEIFPLGGTCYNLDIPTSEQIVGGNDLYITIQPVGSSIQSVIFNSFPDGGSYSPNYEVNLCSMIEPTFRYGEAGSHVIVESIVMISNGNCNDNTNCT